MAINTYISAERFSNRLDEMAEQLADNPESTVDFKAGYSTAWDVASCFREVGGDIWVYTKDSKPEKFTPVLAAVHNAAQAVLAYVDNHGDFWELNTSNTIQPYAWCRLPEVPEDDCDD